MSPGARACDFTLLELSLRRKLKTTPFKFDTFKYHYCIDI